MAINKNKVMDAARKAYEKGQYDKAIKEYLKVVKEDPKDVRVWLKIGDLYAKKDAKQEATDTYLKVATFYSEQGFYLKAVAVYKQILKLDPRLVEVNLKLAELYRQLGLLSDAMQHFEMVAAFFHREGKTREALATLRQLVDLDPENVATRIKLAELYSKEGMVQEAIAEFTTTCDFLRRNGRQEDFIKVAERLLFHKADNISLCTELAQLYLRRNDARRALAKLQVCFKDDPSNIETLSMLAQAFQKLEQKGKTVSVLKELGRVHHERAERREAREVYQRILDLAPSDPDALAYLGQKARPSSLSENVEFDLPDDGMSPVPARSQHAMGRATGSVPLINDGQGLGDSSVEDFRVDEDSFVAELELDEQSGYEQLENSSLEAEEHADEIVKILTETDVYVKYGLHQKAIEHIRRVFELDERNIEARERLKEILLAEGREAEALGELLVLAEQTAAGNPPRATAYLREILSFDAANLDAHELARRFRLELLDSDVPSAAGSEGAIAIADDSRLDFDDLDFDDSSSVMDLDAALESASAQTASVTRRDQMDYGHDDEPRSNITMEVDLEQVEAAVSVSDMDGDDLDFDIEPPGDPLAPLAAASPIDLMGVPELEVPEPAAEWSGPSISEEFAFDPEAAAAFDADRPGPSPDRLPVEDPYAPPSDGPVFGDIVANEVEVVDDLGEDDFELDQARGYDSDLSDDLAFDVDSAVEPATPEFPSQGATEESPGGGTFEEPVFESSQPSSLEDDLDEADFFISQALYDEAREILETLHARHPNHPLVAAKWQELAELANEAVPDAQPPAAEPPVDVHQIDTATKEGRAPSVVLENPLDDEDADTHFDLGLAYKEMGLFGEAIQAFEKVMNVPGREVQCNMMIGLCHREQGTLSEAINQFKAALYISNISNNEKFGLYYEIGVTYEALNDPQEALYYYEMVLKKEPSYRDVASRVESIRRRGGRTPDARAVGSIDDDADLALDSLVLDTTE